MPDYYTLTCPSCGGKLQITQDIERFSCAHCGNEHIVKRSGGIITISPIVEAITGVKIGVDKTASELAILRLEKEINALVQRRDAARLVYNNKPGSNTLIVSLMIVVFGVLCLISGIFGSFNNTDMAWIMVVMSILLIGIGLGVAFLIYSSQIIETGST